MKFVVIFLASFLFSHILHGQKLKIEIFNWTGYDIDSFTIGNKYVGSIKKDSKVIIKDCKEITLLDHLPFDCWDAVIKNKTRETGRIHGFCTTGMMTVKKGNYKFYLKQYDHGYGYYLYWDYYE
jgi:hypothetical protein